MVPNYGKAYEALRDQAQEDEIKWVELQRFCDTRFAQSELKVYQSFLVEWPALLKRMRDLHAKCRSTDEAYAKLSYQITCMTDWYWVANVMILADMLSLCMSVSTTMQTVNVLPWEILEEQEKFVATMKEIAKHLEEHEGDFPQQYFLFLHGKAHIRPGEELRDARRCDNTATREVDGPRCGTRLEQLMRGQFMGEDLTVELEHTIDGERMILTREAAIQQCRINIGYDASDWCKNLASFIDTRFSEEKGGFARPYICLMSGCMDLRRFARLGYEGIAPYQNLDALLEATTITSLMAVYDWMVDAGGIINLPSFPECVASCKRLAHAIVESVSRHVATGKSRPHKWFDESGEGPIVKSGTVIQEEVMTTHAFLQLNIDAYMYMYVHCALKVCNEAVVEGFCSTMGRHAMGVRGLCFDMYAMESIIAYNAPHRARSEKFITQALNHFFKEKKYKNKPKGSWRFFRNDKNRHRLPMSVLSIMLTRKKCVEPDMNKLSLKFME